MKLNHQKIIVELITITAISYASYVAASYLNILEQFLTFAEQYKRYNLDDLLIAGVVLVVFLALFSLERWLEASSLNREIQQRNSALREATAEIKHLQALQLQQPGGRIHKHLASDAPHQLSESTSYQATYYADSHGKPRLRQRANISG